MAISHSSFLSYLCIYLFSPLFLRRHSKLQAGSSYSQRVRRSKLVGTQCTGGGNSRLKLVLSVKLWHFLIRWLLTSGLFSQKVCFLSLSVTLVPALFLEWQELALGM